MATATKNDKPAKTARGPAASKQDNPRRRTPAGTPAPADTPTTPIDPDAVRAAAERRIDELIEQLRAEAARLYPNLPILCCGLETGSGIQQVKLFDGHVRPGRLPSVKALEAAVKKYAADAYADLWTVCEIKFDFKEECVSVHDFLHVYPDGESPLDRYRARMAAEKGGAP
jgi:hypothetical protein